MKLFKKQSFSRFRSAILVSSIQVGSAQLPDTTIIAVTGDIIPEGDAAISQFTINDFALNDAGEVAFTARLDPTQTSDRDILLVGAGQGLIQVVREGDLEVDSNGRFSSFKNLRINEAAQICFASSYSNTIRGAVDESAILIGDGTQLSRIIRAGEVRRTPKIGPVAKL